MFEFKVDYSEVSCVRKFRNFTVHVSLVPIYPKFQASCCSAKDKITIITVHVPYYYCHVTRIPDERLPKKVFYGELQEGSKPSQGGQKKRYKNTLKASLKDFNIPTESWEQSAQDRTKWRCLINKGAAQFEAKRICEAERKRKEWKARAKGSSSDSAQSELTCSICKIWLKHSSTNTQSHMNTQYSGLKMVFLNTERRTIITIADDISLSILTIFHDDNLLIK